MLSVFSMTVSGPDFWSSVWIMCIRLRVIIVYLAFSVIFWVF